jgi:type II secretory ATPase GspE/PulE/Tfp pilus assembly ATPase PilB-like protein
MVGEIRDEETAEIAVHAAMTGHLLLSTLHTNDAITALPRLSQMGIPSFLVASTTNIIVSQRLVRKICINCKEEYKPDKKMIELLKKQFNIEKISAKLQKLKIITSAQNNLGSISFYRGKGCSKCSHSGYKGRIGIYEALEITDKMAELILKNATTADLKIQAEEQEMLTMLEDGFIKVKDGITTIDEIIRVTKE